MKLLRLFRLACLGLLLAAPTWAEELSVKEACPHAKGWKPTNEQLQRILSDHRQWAEKQRGFSRPGEPPISAEGRANLCNANLIGAQLKGAYLPGAQLNDANLFAAELNEADLTYAKLNNTDLRFAKLNGAMLGAAVLNNANLSGAKLKGAYLLDAQLNDANLFAAELNEADLTKAVLNKANLIRAQLKGADLRQAKLNKANLHSAELNGAKLHWAELNNANLIGAVLNGAELVETSIAGVVLAGANLSNALYMPVSQPPDSHVADIKGLQTVRFTSGRETGLVQLRELLQKAGLRDLEREATFAIENGKTKNAIADWRENPGGAAEGVFRQAAFDWTTAYGLYPARTLLLIVALWALLIPVYSLPIWHRPRRSTRPSGIYRVWPKDRVEVKKGKPTLDNPANVERLHARGLAAVGWSAYFSLLSTFQIGFRDFSVGTWLTRTQPRHFVLEASGWVRTVSGLQSLLSVYFLALWVLTYFSRPFQ